MKKKTFMMRAALARVVRRLATALLQLIGNIFKLIFYVDMRLRPRKRYSIPSFSPALVSTSSPKAIPRVVWLTNYTSSVTLSIYMNYWFNRLMAPTFEFRFCDDTDCARFIKDSYPADVYDTYSRLQIGAAKADFWRVLKLFAQGGIYMDIDAALLWPPELFLGADQTELLIRPKDGRLTNYFLASTPGNPFFKAVADQILQNIKDASASSVFDMTGPSVVDGAANSISVSTASYNIICKQGLLTNKAFQYPDDRTRYWVTAQAQRDIVAKQRPLP